MRWNFYNRLLGLSSSAKPWMMFFLRFFFDVEHLIIIGCTIFVHIVLLLLWLMLFSVLSSAVLGICKSLHRRLLLILIMLLMLLFIVLVVLHWGHGIFKSLAWLWDQLLLILLIIWCLRRYEAVFTQCFLELWLHDRFLEELHDTLIFALFN